MKRAAILVAFSLICISTLSFAREPLNLGLAKKAIIRYHDSGQYTEDIKAVTNQAIRYLHYQLSRCCKNKKPAMVFDVDETAISNYADMLKLNFGGTQAQFIEMDYRANAPAIQPVLKLYRYAKAHGVTIFFITGRYSTESDVTVKHLKKVGFTTWEHLYTRPASTYASASAYKIAMRKAISAKGYEIIANIGDQQSDLIGGYADKTFKLPGPFYLLY